MRFTFLAPTAVLCLAALGGVTGCGGGSSAVPDLLPLQVTQGRYAALQFILRTTKANFAAGEEIPFVFSIINTGSAPIPFTGPGFGSPQLAGMRISRVAGGTPVWVSGSLLGGSTSLADDTLAPGEVRNIPINWNQRTNPTTGEPGAQGTLVAPGTYRVSAFSLINLAGVTDRETQLAVAPMEITIR
ncbi:MAG: hypothetical protein V4671_32060 [Armatimonadota bacterium]